MLLDFIVISVVLDILNTFFPANRDIPDSTLLYLCVVLDC